jgi:hypothetical protein
MREVQLKNPGVQFGALVYDPLFGWAGFGTEATRKFTQNCTVGELFRATVEGGQLPPLDALEVLIILRISVRFDTDMQHISIDNITQNFDIYQIFIVRNIL